MSDESATSRLRAGQRCRVGVWYRASGTVQSGHASSTGLDEAPWTLDGRLVELRLVGVANWQRPTTLIELDGGQGTINVPSWAPDGSAFAFVDDPADHQPDPHDLTHRTSGDRSVTETTRRSF